MKNIIITYNTLEKVSQKNEIFAQWDFASAKQLNMEMCSQAVLKLIDLKIFKSFKSKKIEAKIKIENTMNSK